MEFASAGEEVESKGAISRIVGRKGGEVVGGLKLFLGEEKWRGYAQGETLLSLAVVTSFSGSQTTRVLAGS